MIEYALKDGCTLAISRPRAADAAEIVAHFKAVGGETDFLLFNGSGLPLTIKEEEEYVEKLFRHPRNALFIGRIDNEIALACNIKANTSVRTRHNASIGITVRKAFWGLGIGSAALQHLIGHAKRVHVTIINLEVNAENPRAIALYERFGFEHIGRHHNHVCINGRYYDELRMELHLTNWE